MSFGDGVRMAGRPVHRDTYTIYDPFKKPDVADDITYEMEAVSEDHAEEGGMAMIKMMLTLVFAVVSVCAFGMTDARIIDLEGAAEKGDEGAMITLGDCYCVWWRVEKDEVKAVEWYRKAAEKGNVKAMVSLGRRYSMGWGVEKDKVKAVEWYRKAAEKGDEGAMTTLGDCYFDGQGVEKDGVKAVEWYRKAAENGDERAMTTLGDCYRNGWGVEKDKVKAVEWYRKAAVKGDANAKECLLRFSSDDFNGVTFGVAVSTCGYGRVRALDRSKADRNFLQNGANELSCQMVEYHPSRPFREFKEGTISGSWYSGMIYKVQYVYSFERDKSTSVDRAEFKETRAALRRKYGSPSDVNTGYGGDVTEKYEKGDLVVVLKYVAEGNIDRGKMILTASSKRFTRLAEEESGRYHRECAERDASQVRSGGEEAL